MASAKAYKHMVNEEWKAVADMLSQGKLCKTDLEEHHGVRYHSSWATVCTWQSTIVFRRHTYLPRSRHILLCMCLHACMYSCCAGDLSLPVVRLVDSFRQYLSGARREIAHSHRFLRCFMDTCSAFPISMYVCMCSWSDLFFCLLNRNMDKLYW